MPFFEISTITKELQLQEWDDVADLIDRNAYIATILWQEEDIREALREHNIKPTKDNIDKLVCELDVDDMENCEHGWDVINDTIKRVFLFPSFDYE